MAASELRSEYKVGVVLSLELCGKNDQLKACQVNIDDRAPPITVVTAAANVREGSR
jgi:tRNA-binding EMAP/Myf-like protein